MLGFNFLRPFFKGKDSLIVICWNPFNSCQCLQLHRARKRYYELLGSIRTHRPVPLDRQNPCKLSLQQLCRDLPFDNANQGRSGLLLRWRHRRDPLCWYVKKSQSISRQSAKMCRMLGTMQQRALVREVSIRANCAPKSLLFLCCRFFDLVALVFVRR